MQKCSGKARITCSWSSTPVIQRSFKFSSRLPTTAATWEVLSVTLSLACLYRVWCREVHEHWHTIQLHSTNVQVWVLIHHCQSRLLKTLALQYIKVLFMVSCAVEALQWLIATSSFVELYTRLFVPTSKLAYWSSVSTLFPTTRVRSPSLAMLPH